MGSPRLDWTRRRLLCSAGALVVRCSPLAGTGASPGPSGAGDLWVDDDLGEVEDDDELFEEQGDGSPRSATRGLSDWPRWWRQEPPPRAVWAADEDSTDYKHLNAAISAQSFTLDARVLRRALSLAHIPEAALGGRVLIGIRGVTFANRKRRTQRGDRWQASVQLVEAVPDHRTEQCILGVWNRAGGDGFWTGPGSTVCAVDYMFGQAEAFASAQKTEENLDRFCNLLSAGVYTFRVGTHRNGSNSRQPGAFRLQSKVAVQRNYDKVLQFTNKDPWEFRDADIGDNIHAAYRMAAHRPRFSSAGCQVVKGTMKSRRTRAVPVGPWRQFRIAAGLRPSPTIITPNAANKKLVHTNEDGRLFSYVLLTGRELRLAAALKAGEAAPNLEKLRRGSNGDAVKKLRSALRLPAGDAFDFELQRAFIQRQSIQLGWADGVLTRARLQQMGLPAVFG